MSFGSDARERREALVLVPPAIDDGEGVFVPMRRYVALEAAPGLVVMNDKILEIERLAELCRLADGGVDHGGALCVGVKSQGIV